MIDLYGWDTISLTEISLVNRALAGAKNRLVTEFRFEDEDLLLQGRFDAWQIAPHGTVQRLNLRLPIATGRIEGWAGKVDLSGIVLTLRVILRFLDAPDAAGGKHLVFDLDTSLEKEAGEGVEPVTVDDPDGRLNDIQARALKTAAAACLSANTAGVSFVFASVRARGTSDADSLVTPHHDWLLLVLADGSQYLGIVGALSRPAKGASAVDAKLVKGGPSAVLALSETLLACRFLHPALSDSFRPRAGFTVKGSVVQNAKHIHLKPIKKGLVKMEPVITKLRLYPEKTGLKCKVSVAVPLPVFAKFTSEIEMTMPLVFDKKTGRIGFKPDTNPKETHTIGFPKALDFLIGWLIRWILSFFDTPIHALIAHISTQFQGLNSRAVNTVRWTGIRDFKVGGAEMDGTIALRDTRSVD